MTRRSDLYRVAVECCASGLVMYNASDSGIVLVNAETERLFGYSRDELIGQRIDILIPTPNADEAFALPQGDHAFLGISKDGSEFPLESITMRPAGATDRWRSRS